MTKHTAPRKRGLLALLVLLAVIVSACNLSGAPSEEQIAQTDTALATVPPTRTPQSTSGIPTTVPVTQFPNQPTFTFPTSIIIVPTSQPPQVFPSSTPLPVSIVILSPVSGNVVAGNVQILGSAIHPQFLQYQVEFGPDPNPGNLWFPATSAVTTPVLNGLLGIWNTTTVQDSRYQLRLRVYLRDGTLLTTVIGNIAVQNRVNTPIPSATPNIPRPIAAFTQDKASGNVPLTVQFSNQSTGTINSLVWNFGDGNSSNQVNPSHTFGSPGLYTVTLTVNGPGGSSNVTRQINVTSPTAPVAGFTQDRTAGVAPLTVQFTDQSSGSVTTYLWNFSDGSTTTERNPVHTFTTPGTYNIFLTVTGPGGSSSVTRQITVNSVIPPTATPTSTFTPTFTPSPTSTATATVIPPADTSTPTETTTAVPPTATFTATATTTEIPPSATFTPTEIPAPQSMFSASGVLNDPLSVQFTDQSTGAITARLWDFGDGTTSNEQNPLHTYAADGTYTVTLTVGIADGRTDSHSEDVTVATPISAAFSAQINGLSVQFTNQSTGAVSSLTWDFGDGSNSTDVNPQHTYASSGTYTVTLTIGSADGRSNSHSENLTVAAPLVAGFTAQPNGLDVQFTNQSSGDVSSVAWDFGDGATSNEVNPLHTYPAGGTYTVTLTIGSADGRTNSTNQQVTVSAPLVAGFTAQPNGLDVQFTNQSSGDVASVAWDFGDGATSNDVNPLHTYAAGGTYTVTLTIGSADGRSNSTNQQVTVSSPLHADFITQVNGLDVQFTSQSTGDVVAYMWDFGDGATSNEQNPLHTYAAGGTYTVNLTVGSADGRTDTRTLDVTTAAPLSVQFSSQITGLDVQFTAQPSSDVIGYQWDFGDGTSSNEQNPLHTYGNGGNYTVTLTVTDANGRSANVSNDIALQAPQPTQPQQTLVDTTPIMPDINALAGSLSNIFQTGLSTGKQATVFAKAGDSVFTQPNVLSPFATGGQYALNGNDDLQSVIDWFNQTDLNGATSFSRLGVAVNPNWTAQDLLGPNNADPSVCNGGESPLACELRITQPAIMFVAIGQSDANSGTNVNAFSNTLAQIVGTISSNGTIPVLLTIPDDGSNPAVSAINDAIITVASQNNVPLLNAARALNELPNRALNAAPTGPGDLGADAVSNYGVNALNLDLLRVFAAMRNIIGINP